MLPRLTASTASASEPTLAASCTPGTELHDLRDPVADQQYRVLDQQYPQILTLDIPFSFGYWMIWFLNA